MQLFLFFSIPPSHFSQVYNDNPASLHTPSSPSSSLLPSLVERVCVCVNIIGDLEHMCASLWRPTNPWSSGPLSIHHSFSLSSLPSFPLLFYNCRPSSHFLLSKFISLPLPHRPSSCCLSQQTLPPNALRLTTLFPFKITIIKSAAKWERVCAAGVTMQRFDVPFQHDSINISSSVPNYCCTHSCTIILIMHNLCINTPRSTYYLIPICPALTVRKKTHSTRSALLSWVGFPVIKPQHSLLLISPTSLSFFSSLSRPLHRSLF